MMTNSFNLKRLAFAPYYIKFELDDGVKEYIKFELDDGVKVNYGKFGDLLAEVKQVATTKE